MIEIASETLMTLEQVAEKLLVSKAIVVKWINYGSKGVKLEALKFGKHWRTSEEALQRFGERMTPGQTPQPMTITASQRQRQNEAARKVLDEILGVRKCETCNTVIDTHKKTIPKNEKLWCTACLVKLPSATMAQRIRTFRWAARITQEQLSKRTGIPIHEIRSYELNKAMPSKAQLDKLIDVLGDGFLAGVDMSLKDSSKTVVT